MGGRFLVTGGSGFIGSALIRQLLAGPVEKLVNFDRLTYAASPDALAEIGADERYQLVEGDVADRETIERAIQLCRPDTIFHLAAESHVDRSLDGPEIFIRTNIEGGFRVLEGALTWWRDLSGSAREGFRLVMVSTDEVYGALGPDDPPFNESNPTRPNSPYAASKAASDGLARAWHSSFGLPVIVTHCGNNYGPWQYPEKLIPVIIAACLDGRAIPIYGDGQQVRDWIHVDDHVRALLRIATDGRIGASYAIGGSGERSNLSLVQTICAILDRMHPASHASSYAEQVTYVADRPGHDRRYAIDARLIRDELGWQPQESLHTGLEATIAWYLAHQDWWRRLVAGPDGAASRLGLARSGGSAA